MSYDGDENFYLIGQYDGSCPNEDYSWPVKLPYTLPPCQRCTFAWTWINSVGNREFYMNCADVTITEGPYSANYFYGIPIDVANLPGYPIEQPQGSDGPPGQAILIPNYYN